MNTEDMNSQTEEFFDEEQALDNLKCLQKHQVENYFHAYTAIKLLAKLSREREYKEKLLAMSNSIFIMMQEDVAEQIPLDTLIRFSQAAIAQANRMVEEYLSHEFDSEEIGEVH